MASPFMFAFTAPTSPTPTLPGDVEVYALQVDREIGALNMDIAAAINGGKPVLPAEFVAQRNAFVEEWKWFLANYTGLGWLTTKPSAAWDQVGQYESKNEAWKAKFQALGGSSVGPGPQERPKDPDFIGAVKWGVAAVLAGVAAYGVYMFAPRRK